MTTIEALQEWYVSQCNEDWEHSYGVEIGTLDNPGWTLSIDLIDTDVEDVAFAEHSYGVGKESEPDDQNWLICKVENHKFIGNCGPRLLEEMITIFLSWARANA